MNWKIITMVIVKFLMLFRGSKSTSKLAAIEVEDIQSVTGHWYVACYIAHPFQPRLTQLQYQITNNDEGLKIIQTGLNKRKKKQLEYEKAMVFHQSPKLAWFNVEDSNPYRRQFKFIYLNEDKNQAIVVGPAMNTVKLLYRNLDFTKVELDRLILHIDSLGFKIQKLVRVEQA